MNADDQSHAADNRDNRDSLFLVLVLLGVITAAGGTDDHIIHHFFVAKLALHITFLFLPFRGIKDHDSLSRKNMNCKAILDLFTDKISS